MCLKIYSTELTASYIMQEEEVSEYYDTTIEIIKNERQKLNKYIEPKAQMGQSQTV